MAMNQVKVPTIISYGSYNEKFSWGSQASDDYSIHGIKLLLDPNQDMPSYIPESTLKSNLKHCGKPAVDVAADFLQAMYKYALERLELEFPLEYVKICEKKLILSVPAVWSDKAKDLTLQVGISHRIFFARLTTSHLKAARQAGLHPVALVKEPEAAAFHTLNRLKNKGVAV